MNHELRIKNMAPEVKPSFKGVRRDGRLKLEVKPWERVAKGLTSGAFIFIIFLFSYFIIHNSASAAVLQLPPNNLGLAPLEIADAWQENICLINKALSV